jgi:hypothetical protein
VNSLDWKHFVNSVSKHSMISFRTRSRGGNDFNCGPSSLGTTSSVLNPFTVSFASLRFDFPYFHARHMRTTETSALISTLIACVAFFHQGRDKSQIVAAPSNVPEHKMDWRRFTLLVVAEAVVGLFLYALFTFIPVALQVLITVASWVIVAIETWTFPKNKSLGSLLRAITSAAVFLCWLAWRITYEQVWSRVELVGVCLMAGLIFLDRRQEWLDS